MIAVDVVDIQKFYIDIQCIQFGYIPDPVLINMLRFLRQTSHTFSQSISHNDQGVPGLVHPGAYLSHLIVLISSFH